MTSLLIIIVLVLLAIALWQLTKIFDLTQVGKVDDSQIANDGDNNTQGIFDVRFLGIHLHFYNLRIDKMGIFGLAYLGF